MAQITNQAQLLYNGNVINSNIAVSDIRGVLTAGKKAIPETYRPGDTVTFAVSAVNSGDTAITGVTVTDNQGAYLSGTTTLYPLMLLEGGVALYINGTLADTPTVTAGPPLEFSGITIPAGGNMVLIYKATANEFAPLGTGAQIVNTATVTGAELVNPTEVSATVTPVTTADLRIVKSISPVPVVENGSVTYTFEIRNYGAVAVPADGGLLLSDTFRPVLSGLSVTRDGTTLTPTTDYTYTPATGEFSTVAGALTVPAATYTQDPTSGAWSVTPGETTVTVTGTI